MDIMELRPHHILDIVKSYGAGSAFRPHPYGHAVHTVAKQILSDLEIKVRLIVGSDEICQPCIHLQPDGLCDDVLHQLNPPISKQTYNDDLDRRLLAYLGLTACTVMTVREYLTIINDHVPGIEQLCTHPKEDRQARVDGLTRGLQKLGIRGDP